MRGRFDLGSPCDPVFGGRNSVTKGKSRVAYGFHEHATLLQGEMALANEATGETVDYGPGDSWIIAKGTQVLWGIRSAVELKSYPVVTTDLSAGLRM